MAFRRGTLQLHRPVVTVADSAAPTNKLLAFDTKGWDGLLASLSYASNGGTASFTVMPYFWNTELAQYEADPAQSKDFTGDGNYVWAVKCYGKLTYLAVTAMTGTAPTLSISASVASEHMVIG